MRALIVVFPLSSAKNMERHYLLSGDADGAIMLWELSLIDQKVVLVHLASISKWLVFRLASELVYGT